MLKREAMSPESPPFPAWRNRLAQLPLAQDARPVPTLKPKPCTSQSRPELTRAHLIRLGTQHTRSLSSAPLHRAVRASAVQCSPRPSADTSGSGGGHGHVHTALVPKCKSGRLSGQRPCFFPPDSRSEGLLAQTSQHSVCWSQAPHPDLRLCGAITSPHLAPPCGYVTCLLRNPSD